MRVLGQFGIAAVSRAVLRHALAAGSVLALTGLAAAGESGARLCAGYSGVPAAEGADAPAGMARIKGGFFSFGSDRFYPEERPVRPARVGTFWIDRTEVTNAQFEAFVAATGYKTLAERGIDPKRYRELPPEAFVPGSMVFVEPATSAQRADDTQWWAFVPGADWRHPEGPRSSIAGRENRPVVQVTFDDAKAYAVWLGRDLPTEAEWEYAARGGIDGADYSWGDEPNPDGKWMANSWQGFFPYQDDGSDGHHGTAPVGCYEPNGYGLFDMAGNVWEWATDAYRPGHAGTTAPAAPPVRETGPAPAHVIKGGSWLCSPTFCGRFRPAARQPQEADLGTTHVGFRTVLREPDSSR